VANTSTSRLSAVNLSLAYGAVKVLNNISLSIPDGRITALIGANGSGKSTLLKALGRIMQPTGGTVYLDGVDISSLTGKSVARTLALLPQSPISPEGLTIRQLCRFGRHPHKGILSPHTRHDEEVVQAALSATKLTGLSERSLDRLSGGQRQRAWIAMSLAQETPILLLDEPTTYLDIAHQLEILELLKELNQTLGRTIVMVVHDLNHATQYADHIIAISDGTVHATGDPAAVLTTELIRKVYGVDSLVIPHPVTGKPLCLPLVPR
jgi:ABC-type cobalamin/Fe3+-siderophores transport system ATPase subunit